MLSCRPNPAHGSQDLSEIPTVLDSTLTSGLADLIQSLPPFSGTVSSWVQQGGAQGWAEERPQTTPTPSMVSLPYTHQALAGCMAHLESS